MTKKTGGFRLPETIDPAWRVGIVASYYYKEEMDSLVAGAKEVLLAAGLPKANVTVWEAPGSFEVPLIGSALSKANKVDALLGLGIIIEGKTHHARLLADQVARGIMDIQVRDAIPFAFEILYVNDIAQAQERSTGDMNKGKEGAFAVLHSLAEIQRIRGALS